MNTRMIQKPFLLALVAAALLTSNALGQQANVSSKPATAVKAVKVSVPVKEAEVGQQVQVTVAATDASGNPVNEKASAYFAGPFDIAAVDDDGNVKLFGTGEVTVGAIVGGVPALTTFMVKPPSIKTIELSAPKTPLLAGSTVQLNAVTRVFNGDPRTGVPIDWTSDNTSVARVDAGGVVRGVGPGKATITATSGSATAKTTISVVKTNLRSLSVTAGAKSARTGDVVYFTAKADPANDFATRWSVSGSGATIDADGAFVAELPGTYIVTGTSGTTSSSASIVVAPRNLEREIKVVGRAPMKEFQGAEQWIIGNYAYYSTIADRFFVYDISDPAKPKLTDTVKVDARLVNDIMTTADGKILVISREGASNRKNGIAFYDTSDPAHPKLISEYTATVTGGVHSAFVHDHYVYLTDDATGSMRVIDFKDVKNPKEVARWQTEPQHAAMIRTKEGENIAGRYIHDLQVKDGLAYLAYWHDGLVILDVGAGLKGGSPERPQLVSQLRFNHNELYGNGWLAGTHSVYRYKNYVFIGDEVFPSLFDIKSPRRFPVRGIVHVVDVSDINNPRKVAEYPVPEGAAHNMWVEDDVMYVGYYSGGGRIVDVSGELRGDLYRQGREIARVWTGDPNGFRANLPFTWGAQPHNGLIYFNDIHSGLWIVKLGEKIDKGSTTAPGP
ncbi:MAG TPA: Ig-like domain-containing protein [Pyrinomonadaceae bacterium]|nr:Ig-like domain-containing protein [Pyrinomonadaceae bacterium]